MELTSLAPLKISPTILLSNHKIALSPLFLKLCAIELSAIIFQNVTNKKWKERAEHLLRRGWGLSSETFDPEMRGIRQPKKENQLLDASIGEQLQTPESEHGTAPEDERRDRKRAKKEPFDNTALAAVISLLPSRTPPRVTFEPKGLMMELTKEYQLV